VAQAGVGLKRVLKLALFIDIFLMNIRTLLTGGYSYPEIIYQAKRFTEKFHMNDLVFVALIVGFFLISGLYVHFCDKL